MLDTYGIPNRIAAPGYSNHQRGIALDFLQVRTAGNAIRNSTSSAAVGKWRQTWFHRWLEANAASYGFRPYAKEPWHWEFSGAAPASEAFEDSDALELADAEELSHEEAADLWAGETEEESPESFEQAESARWTGKDPALLADFRETDEEVVDASETQDFAELLAPEEAEEEDERLLASADVLSSETLLDLTGPPEESSFAEDELAARSIEVGADRTLDPSVEAIAERIAAQSQFFEYDQPPQRRWTRCFAIADVGRVGAAYAANSAAARANPIDRAACIVMLNVGIGELLRLLLRPWPARRGSSRRVQMPRLTTHSIERAMEQLRRRGYARTAVIMDFIDRRGRRAGTLKPERLRDSVRAAVLARAETAGCWYAFGLSIMDGYHSVLLLVDRTGAVARIFWLDQHRVSDVTNDLDNWITDRTRNWWQAVMDAKNVGYDTTVRLWALRKPVAT